MPKMSKDTISVDVDELRDLKAKLAKLEMENSSLKKSKQQTPITFKVSTKKACSVYGLQRMPCTLYKAQWEILMDKKEELLAFLEENADELATKDDPKQDKTMKKKISKRSCDYDSNSDSDSE